MEMVGGEKSEEDEGSEGEDAVEGKVSVFFNDTAKPMWIILFLSLMCRLKLIKTMYLCTSIL